MPSQRTVLVCLGLGLVVLFLQGARHLTGARVVGRFTAPGGDECAVVQQFNWGGEPFTTRFVVRSAGSSWDCFYYDHQDSFWGSSPEHALDGGSQVQFLRNGKVAITYDWRTGTFTHHRLNRREVEPLTRLRSSWKPGRPIRSRDELPPAARQKE